LKDEIDKLALENAEKLKIQQVLEQKNIELKKYNEEIKAANTFFNMSADMLFVATDTHFIKVNPSFSALLGFDEKEILETPFMNFVHPDDINSLMDELVTIADGIATQHYESRFKTKNGDYLWMDWSVTPDTTTNLRYGIAHDISERKKTEEDLIKAKELAERLSAVKDQFIANISHEIRTPLNSVIGFTDLLRQTNLDAIQLNYIENVQTAGENLLLIIEDILDISKIESGKLKLETKPFNLQKTLKHVYNLLKEKAN
jgi:PAS domain S-box-containing protein